MKQITRYIVPALASAALLLGACTKGFEKINTDPNKISIISPGTLLNPTLYELAAFNMQKADDITFDLMQVALNFPSPTPGMHRYDVNEGTGSSTWSTYYRWLKNIREIREAAVAAGDPNYAAIALTLNAWVYANLTDCFGSVPMEEAIRADEGIIQPRYNTQEEIYRTIIADLDSANRLFNTSRAMTFGTDILFGNNVTNWKRFCNSLQMRLLLRVSARPEMNAWTRLDSIINNPTKYPVFNANTEAAVLKLTGVYPLSSPWGRPQDFTTGRAAAQFFLDSLNVLNDPRRARFASQAKDLNNVNIGYKGIPSGYTGSESQFNFTPSNLLQALISAPMTCPILTYAEVEFIKAEFYHRSQRHDLARAAYEKGVKAAVEQWGATMPATYFSNASAAYNGTLQRIHLQKYYALFFNDYQQWFEYRRTGLPVLPQGPGMLNGGVMPSRLIYPVSQRIYNLEHYNSAVSQMGGDHINIKAWWQQ
ncbi:SusD/RagB family nutrient-binding outer membrane lipoprotein [Flaviaesturariibacter amylovorans]|uniref:SusD/RagB family nutrient-binding outer membrane lipoprotein n=1 Tax=Flaviaesturariibacter amylovorans TaxID=1084520 RepID=A0ABP8H7N8_9BACT